MHKLVVTIMTILALSLSLGVATAQTQPTVIPAQQPEVVITPPAIAPLRTDWAGVSLGINPLLSGYYGIAGGLGPDIDLRFRVGVNALVGLGLSAGADALFNVTQFGAANEFGLYVGGGPSFSFVSITGISVLGLGVSGLAGVDYRLGPDLSLFGEIGAGFQYGIITGALVDFPVGIGGLLPDFRTAVGLNFHF